MPHNNFLASLDFFDSLDSLPPKWKAILLIVLCATLVIGWIAEAMGFLWPVVRAVWEIVSGVWKLIFGRIGR